MRRQEHNQPHEQSPAEVVRSFGVEAVKCRSGVRLGVVGFIKWIVIGSGPGCGRATFECDVAARGPGIRRCKLRRQFQHRSRRFRRHIEACDHCSAYVEQMRLVIEASGRLTEDDIDPAAREELLDAFRGWKDGR